MNKISLKLRTNKYLSLNSDTLYLLYDNKQYVIKIVVIKYRQIKTFFATFFILPPL